MTQVLSKFAVEFDFTADGENDHASHTIAAYDESSALERAIKRTQLDYGSDWESIDNVKIERLG